MRGLSGHIAIALLYFLLAAVLGVVLRLFPVTGIPVQYRFLVHTHSHIALLGWVYIALTTLLYKLYLGASIKKHLYKRIFWFTQCTLIGMLCTFPFMGYALFSIIFSTLFLLVSYWFTWFFMKYTPGALQQKTSYLFVRAGLLYMIISSLGPWALGGIMSTLGSTSIWYRIAIYFYLHFQYNGWFIMALTGIFLFALEYAGFAFSKRTLKNVFVLLNLGIVLSFFLSVLWTEPHFTFDLLGALGAVLQLLSILILIAHLKKKNTGKLIFTSFNRVLLITATSLLFFKMILQLISALPYFVNLTYRILDFVIGYLHLTFLGVVSFFLFALLNHFRLLNLSKKGYYIYLAGFILSELCIFYKGFVILKQQALFEEYFHTLVFVSLLIPIGIFIILIKSFLYRASTKLNT